jgi:RimJ/RimL family protein N-acetyltransferase
MSGPAPRETARLRFRRFRRDDLPAMRELASDAGIMRYTRAMVPQTEEQSIARLEKHIAAQPGREPLGIWAAEFRETGAFAGWFMVCRVTEDPRPELGFMLPRRLWNQGITTEGARELCRHAREDLGFPEIIACTRIENATSQRVLEKLGFARVEGGEHPEVLYHYRLGP